MTAPQSSPLVVLDGVEVRLGGRPVLSGVSLALREGESWAVLGANGSGKSTLLRLLRGELWPHHQGGGRRTFHLGGRPEESPIGARERIGLVSPELAQAYVRRDWGLPVEAVVRSGFTDEVWPPEAATPAQAARVAEVLAELGVAALAPRSVLTLSSGEVRKVLLARALVGRPRLLLLDEPCHGLDAPSRAAFLALVSRVARGGTPVVLATHRHDELVPEITRVAVLHGGRILVTGAFRAERDPARAAALATAGPDAARLAGNSNYGRALRAFHAGWRGAVTRRTTVIVIGDGRTNYHPPCAWVLDDLRRRAGRLLWICPEERWAWGQGDSEMPLYASRVERVAVVTSLPGLEGVADALIPRRGGRPGRLRA